MTPIGISVTVVLIIGLSLAGVVAMRGQVAGPAIFQSQTISRTEED